jgi:7-cyano-7-deazaguanine tRNA-ribosyltransferase
LPRPFFFEVKETDLMGRVGQVTVGKKRFETPCLTPVVHPVWRDIPLSQFKAMGFDVLMTNSYILYKRQGKEAIEKGIHDLIGFEGVIMTDSGGYQVLEYGDAEFTPEEIAEFQSKIGSDLAVTLDRPTGYSISRAHARETMRASLSAAEATIRKFPDSETTWVGPIQGGVFGDLVRASARGLTRAGFQFLALGSPVELMEGYMFSPLVEMIVNARSAMAYAMPMHLFGAGHPLTLPLSVALGCDTFDSASYMLYAKKDRYMTERGTVPLDRMTYLPCGCPVCNSTSLEALRAEPREDRVRKVALHNLHVLRADVLRCKEAIYEGRLWDLVEERAMAHPRSASAFRALVRDRVDWLAKPTRLLKLRGLMVRSEEDTSRPELALARKHLSRLMSARRPAAKTIAVLVTSSAAPPLTRRSAKVPRAGALGKAEIYRINPQIGPYPAELEFVFPFAQTISDRQATEASLTASVKKLRAMGYAKVVVARGSRGIARARTRKRAPRSR